MPAPIAAATAVCAAREDAVVFALRAARRSAARAIRAWFVFELCFTVCPPGDAAPHIPEVT
jgi:hypothetical protein